MRLLLLFLFLTLLQATFSQSDACSSATALTVSANCAAPVAGTTTGASQTIAGCTGNADDDVWYQFVATGTSHQIVVTPIAGMDPVVQLFSGACASLVSLSCQDNYGDGVAETINYNGLSIGTTYRIRVYHYFAGSGSGNFTVCVTNPPPSPSNDNCASSVPLNVNSSCTYTSSTTDGASLSMVGCAGTADDDVWFSFVATNSLQTVTVDPLESLDLVFQVFSGSCGALNSILCIDNTFTSQTEQSNLVGLVPGQTYYVRVYDYYSGSTGDFQICVTGTPTAVPTNDEPCNAIQLPAVTSACQYAQFTTVGASASLGAPTPSTCAGGGGAAIGGFSSSSSDVWFAITVPASGNIDITPQPNGGGGTISDGVMALYSGTCASLTQIACSDDNNYPGSANDLLPFISQSGLTPGATVYLRYFGFGSSTGSFGICVSTATNDDCVNALYICDINGYSASTSASYTPDRPDNMRGNNEDINGVNMPDGVNTGGIFGQGGPWGTGAPFYDVIINNNSWIKFTAASTTATLNVNIYDCWVGNYPSGGIQMQIFEGVNCTNFVPVSNFEESSTGFTITANNLTIGSDYYLMVDGYAGDICNYTITANSGVQFPDIVDVPSICSGDSVILTAPPGATSYEWQHDGSTTQQVTVVPSTTQTYYCEVTGLCDYKQTLDVIVTVNPDPIISINNGNSIAICEGTTATLTASGGTSYIWSTGQSGSNIGVTPGFDSTFIVTGTDANGCVGLDTIDVVVNNLPVLSANPIANDSDCGAANGSLNGASGSGTPSIAYIWDNGSVVVGNTADLLNVPAGNYYLTLTDGNNCTANFGPFNISNPGAPPAPDLIVSDNTPCLTADVQLEATSTAAGAVFNWTGPGGFTASGTTVNLTNVSSVNQGNYCVSATVSGCTGPTSCEMIIVLSDPPVNLQATGNDSTICLGSSFELTASGASTYSWKGPNGFNSNNTIVQIDPATAIDEGYYVLIGTDINGCLAADSMYVAILPLPDIDVSADNSNAIYCLGTIATLSAGGAVNYNWTGPDGYTATNTNVTILDLNSADEGYYVVTGTDNNGCSSIDSIYLNVVTDVPANSPGDTVLCPGEPLALYGNGGDDYIWSGPGGFSSQEQNPLVTNSVDFDDIGWYYLTVVDTNGCLGYDSSYVEVSHNENCLFIPNLITPDKDGSNEVWYIAGIESYLNAEVEIYNRWGNMVYRAAPYLNDWDGKVNQGTTIDGSDGKVPVGTYFYIIRLNEGDKPPFKGYLEVQY